jgi:hypothetical protein
MNTLPKAQDASARLTAQGYFRPGSYERGVEMLREEVIEDRPRRILLARRIAALLRELDANGKAMEAAYAPSSCPPEPAELKVTHRGPFGPLKIDVDPKWIREMLPDCSPRSRRGRQLRKLLSMHERHNALIWTDRQMSGIGPLADERKRIEEDLVAAAKEASSLDTSRTLSGAPNAALRAAALLAVGLATSTTGRTPLRSWRPF